MNGDTTREREVAAAYCGCRSEIVYQATQFIETRIVYCPLHAAARQMLEALERIEASHGQVNGFRCVYCNRQAGHHETCPCAISRAAIARATQGVKT